jgi:hypothetical protein
MPPGTTSRVRGRRREDKVTSISFSERLHASSGSTARQASFSALEWSVIALARRDRLSSLDQPGRIAKALASLFGLWRDSALADGRLEALRRMAVLAWHKGHAVPPSELHAFKAAGFTIDQYELLQVSVGRGRSQREDKAA